jgi:hypothetical protein
MRARSPWDAESPSLAGVAPAAPYAYLESRHRTEIMLRWQAPTPCNGATFGQGQHSSARNIEGVVAFAGQRAAVRNTEEVGVVGVGQRLGRGAPAHAAVRARPRCGPRGRGRGRALGSCIDIRARSPAPPGARRDRRRSRGGGRKRQSCPCPSRQRWGGGRALRRASHPTRGRSTRTAGGCMPTPPGRRSAPPLRTGSAPSMCEPCSIRSSALPPGRAVPTRFSSRRQRPDGRICRTRGWRSWAGVAALRVVLLALSTSVASSLVPQQWRQRGLHREERGNAPGWGSGGGGLGAGCWSDRACAALRGWGKGRLPQSAATANSSRRAK